MRDILIPDIWIPPSAHLHHDRALLFESDPVHQAWSVPSTATVGQLMTAAYWNQQVRDNMIYLHGDATHWGSVLDYQEATVAPAASTANTAATATAQLTGNAVSLDGSTSVIVEFYCPHWAFAGTGAVFLSLWDGATALGDIFRLTIGGGPQPVAILVRRHLAAPSAGSHTYSIRGWANTAGGSIQILCGAGGSGVLMPAYLKVTTA